MNNTEIKFRWFSNELGISNPITLDTIIHEGYFPTLIFGDTSLVIVDLDLGKLSKPMRYTGLKDTSGKEIYEGDIVYNEDWLDPVVIEYSEYISGTSQFSDLYIGFYFPLEDDSEIDLEVIGNIYENPELL